MARIDIYFAQKVPITAFVSVSTFLIAGALFLRQDASGTRSIAAFQAALNDLTWQSREGREAGHADDTTAFGIPESTTLPPGHVVHHRCY